MAATEEPLLRRWRRAMARLLRLFSGALGGALAASPALAVDLPGDRAEALLHVYEGGGVSASGPALLVRKSLADRVALSAQYYVDMVSNASIDVVTTASPFKEKRTAWDLGLDTVVRDATIRFGVSSSDEPDYTVRGASVDVTQETFGGMTTVSLGYSRSHDQVGKKDIGFFDSTRHWQYRAGVTQILTPRWLATLNFEAVSDSGFLGSPYRSARVFGAAVPERNPRTRSSRAIKAGTVADLGREGVRQAVRGEYRYYWDTWDIAAHTVEAGYSRYFGDNWLSDGFVRLHSQRKALFYSDNASAETAYVSRNRQLSTFTTLGFGLKSAWTMTRVPGRYEVKLHGGYEFVRFQYKDFTDLRSGNPYRFNGHLLHLYVSSTF